MKKCLSVLLCIALIVSCLPAFAQNNDELASVVFNLSDDGKESYAVKYSGALYSMKLTIKEYKHSVSDSSNPIDITSFITDKDGNFIEDIAIIEVKTTEGTAVLKLNTSFGTGAGTNIDPYKIYNSRHWLNIDKYSDSSFIQMEDLIITEPCKTFSGSFDGNNKKLNLCIDKPDMENVGLFQTGTSDFIFKNCQTYGFIKGEKNVGALIGYAENDSSGKSKIKDCVNYASVNSKNGGAGGFLGLSNNSTNIGKTNFENLINYGEITTEQGSYTGGITGLLYGKMVNCVNHGSIVGSNATGGLVGIHYGTIDRSINSGDVTGNTSGAYVAGIAGISRGASNTVRNSYNTGTISGVSGSVATGITNGYTGSGGGFGIHTSFNYGKADNPLYNVINNIEQDNQVVYRSYYLSETGKIGDLGTPLTESEMKNFNNFSGFQTTHWEMKENASYPTLVGNYGEASIIPYNYMAEATLGHPLTICKANDCAAANFNGDDYLYVTSQGTPALFSVYNLDKKELVGAYELVGTRSPWTHEVTTDGTVYIAVDRKMFSYNPRNQELTDLGYYDSTQRATFDICSDPQGNVYIGTMPDAKVIKFDPATKKYTEVGNTKRPEAKESYARSLVYKDNNLYIIGFDGSTNILYKMPLDTPSKPVAFDIPDVEGYFKASDIYWAYTVTLAEDLILIFAYFKVGGPNLIAFDTVTEKFIDVGMRDKFKGMYLTPVKDHKTYMIGNGGQMFELDVQKRVTTKMEGFTVAATDEFNGGGWITLENNPDFPGESLVTIDNDTGYPVFINPQTQKRMAWDDVLLEGGDITVHNITKGPEGKIYIGGYMGNRAAVLTPETGEIYRIFVDQTEGMVQYKDKMYFGTYTGGVLHEYDPQKPPETLKNPHVLGKAEGDRPFAMLAYDDKIFMGSIPEYGYLNAPLEYWDFNLGKMVSCGIMVPDQSINCLIEKDGLIYGSTTIFGGNASVTKPGPAKIFIYDPHNNKVLKTFTPELKDVEILNWIGGIAFDKNGYLWGITGTTLFKLDPVTFETIKQINFNNYTWTGTDGWKPIRLKFDENGLLYVSIDGLKVINTETYEWKDLSYLTEVNPGNIIYEFDDYGNLYYATANNGELRILRRSELELITEDLTDVKDYFKDKIGLKINNPYMIINGVYTLVDTKNKNAAPFLYKGKTYLPLRTIAEAVEAQVDYDDATKTATIENDDLCVVIGTGNQNTKVIVNGKYMLLSNYPILKDGRVYLPLRDVASLFSKQIFWNDSGTIILSDETLNIEKDLMSNIRNYFDFYIAEDYKEYINRE